MARSAPASAASCRSTRRARGRPATFSVAGDALARDGARRSRCRCQPADPALVDRRHLGIRGDAGAARVGTRDGDPVRTGARTRQGAQAAISTPVSRGRTRSRWLTTKRRCSSTTSSTTYGEAKLQALVSCTAKASRGNDAIEKRVGVTLHELQASFDKALDSRFGSIRQRCAPSGTPDTGGEATSAGEDITGLRRPLRRIPAITRRSSPTGRRCGRRRSRRVRAARESGGAGARCHRRGQPARGDGASGRAAGRHARAMPNTGAARTRSHRDRRGTAARCLGRRNRAQPSLMQAYERIVAIDPFDPAAQQVLGQLALKTNEPETAIRNSRRRSRSGRPTRRRHTAILARATCWPMAADAKARSARGARDRAQFRSRAGAAAALHKRIRRGRWPPMKRLLPAAAVLGPLLWAGARRFRARADAQRTATARFPVRRPAVDLRAHSL